MKRTYLILVLAILLVGVLSNTAVAEHEWDHRYVINGEVTELSGDPASGVKVEVDCSEGATDPDLCGHNSEESEKTNLSGTFTLELHVHAGQDGKFLVLLIDGQQFNHTLDLTGPDGEPTEEDREVELEFSLDHDVARTQTYVIALLFLATILVPCIYFVMKFRSKSKDSPSPSKRKKGVGGSDGRFTAGGGGEIGGMTTCPRCDVAVKMSNLAGHLTKVHTVSKSKAEEIASEVLDSQLD
jgi:hypothetical protein